jgi:hypothetical protein
MAIRTAMFYLAWPGRSTTRWERPTFLQTAESFIPNHGQTGDASITYTV